MDYYRNTIELVGHSIDALGVGIMVVGGMIASVRFLRAQRASFSVAYRAYRQDLGRAILLGLEFLVAGDIIRTVAVAPTLENVVILGGIVLIRTFLSMSLQLEVEGRLPWKTEPASGDSGGASGTR